MASSSSSTPEDTEIDKILVLSGEHHLLEISLSSGSSRILIEHDCKLNLPSSFSPLVDNRYVYMVGGGNQYRFYGCSDVLFDGCSDVFYYDLVDLTIHRGPSIPTPIWTPQLIVLGSKLFAFSTYISVSYHIICEVLDTASISSVWRPLKISPDVPLARNGLPSVFICYCVLSYATHMNNLFLSLGSDNTPVVTVCYNDSNDTCSHFSKRPLPFSDQGKFVDDICYGFPKKKADKFNYDGPNYYLASYKLSIDWESIDPIVSCQELAKYSLSIPPLSDCCYLRPFYVSSSNVVTIIRATAKTPNQHDSFDVDVEQLSCSLEVDVVQLLAPAPAPAPTKRRHFLAPRKRRKRHLPSPSTPPPVPLYGQFNEESYRFIGVPEAPETDDTQDSSRLLKHTSIPLPLTFADILGDYNL